MQRQRVSRSEFVQFISRYPRHLRVLRQTFGRNPELRYFDDAIDDPLNALVASKLELSANGQSDRYYVNRTAL